jgi:hypothetical protein
MSKTQRHQRGLNLRPTDIGVGLPVPRNRGCPTSEWSVIRPERHPIFPRRLRARIGPLSEMKVSRPRMPPDSEVGPRQTLGDRQDLVRQGRNGPNSGRPPDNDRNRGATRPTIGVGARRGADTIRGNWRAGCRKSRQRANYLSSWVSHLCSSLQGHRDGRMGRV